MLESDIKAMNVYMNQVALATISSFDVGTRPSETSEPKEQIRKYGFAFQGKKVLIG